jgi:hypothetical protein
MAGPPDTAERRPGQGGAPDDAANVRASICGSAFSPLAQAARSAWDELASLAAEARLADHDAGVYSAWHEGGAR